MKVAVVHDWLVTEGGAEKVLEQILECFPDADIFSLVDFLPVTKRHILRYKKVKTSFIQKLPLVKSRYRSFLPVMPLAIEQLDLSGYDLIITSSHAVAKGVLVGPQQLHICYCHTPIRYAWDLQHQYLKESKLDTGILSYITRVILYRIRIWDVRTINAVDYFIANSSFIASRIRRYYRRDAEVIYPNVEIERFSPIDTKEDFYLTASRLVPYKKVDLIIHAFKQMPGKRLIVVGDGPDMTKIKLLAGDNVEILGYQDNDKLTDLMQRAKAFVFAAEEDFGIISVEAQACGTPVIAFGKGGALETVVNYDQPNPTGVFFDKQTPQSIINAVELFESKPWLFKSQNCTNNAQRFNTQRFKEQFKHFVMDKVAIHLSHEYLKVIKSPPKVSLFIPTLNALSHAKEFVSTLKVIANAKLHRLLMIDSSSADATVSVAKQHGFEVMVIKKSEFDHGGTRAIAAEMLKESDYIIYMTQDVVLRNKVALTNLIDYTVNNNLAAAYARQLPFENASHLATHLRQFNYVEDSYIRSYADKDKYGIKCAFSSDSFSIYRTDALFAVGNFKRGIIFAEDMYLFGRLLQQGYLIGYCAEAVCWHSHDYSISEHFKRYFDVGVFQKQFVWIINEFGYPSGEGKRFVWSELIYLLKHNWFLIPVAGTHTFAKYLGHKFGYNYDKLSTKWRKRFSMNRRFWDNLDANLHNHS